MKKLLNLLIIIIVLTITLLLSQSKNFNYNYRLNKLQLELKRYEDENWKLNVEYNKKYDLEYVHNFAKEKLKMSFPKRIKYINE